MEIREMKLVTKWMVASSHDIFGEDIIIESSFLNTGIEKKEQFLVFKGEKHFNTELEAMEFLNKTSDLKNNPDGDPAWIIQKIFVWEKVEEVA